MQKLRVGNISFRAQLLIALLVITAALLVVSAVGICNVVKISAAGEMISERYLPATENLLQADRDLYQSLVAERSALADGLSPAQIKAYDAERLLNIRQADERIRKFAELLQDPQAAAAVENHEKLRAAWAETAAEVMALRLDGNLAGARALSFGRSDAEFTAMRNVVDGLSDYIDEHIGQVTLAAAQDARESWWLLVSISLAGSIVCLFVAITLPAFVHRVLGRIIARMHEISEGDGDLRVRLDIRSGDEFGQLAGGFNAFVSNIELLIRECLQSGTQVQDAANSMRNVVERVDGAVAAQRSATDQVATAINEMAMTVQEVARNSSVTAQSMEEAGEQVMAGQLIVQSTTATVGQLADRIEHAAEMMRQLESRSEEINAMMAVIEGVAAQTNLLALNAAIEAARAGEHGRGFAVVADEVRSLATRTQSSTQEIRTMIERLQEAAHSASAAMSESHAGAGEAVRQSREALDTLLTITAAVQQVSEQNMQIASATEEQTAVAEDINRNIVETRDMAEQTALDAEAMRSATGRIMTGLEQLNALLGKFRTN